ncbi:MAG: OmpH family outer membrane protein [Clostridia bacterium]|nr:OmpH family outer membrane protein [Clostridia bacterium]
MKTRKSTLELTPLLDVVLIILFVFMMMLAQQMAESADIKERAESDVESMENELAVAEDALESLQEEYDELLASSEMTADELERMKYISQQQQDTAENLAKAVADFIDAEQDDIQKLLDENEAPSAEMLDNMSTEDIAAELLKYEAISRQFYFIDIELKTSANRLYINKESTSLGISFDQVSDEAGKADKIEAIKSLIETDIEKRQGGAQMVFITLKVSDDEVYQYAWEVVWSAIGEIQEKYGTDKIFRTHITLMNN